MKLMSFTATLALAAGTAWGQTAPKLTPEIINAEASLNGPSLRGPAVSPDGKLVTVLKGREDDARQLDLWAYDLATGEPRMLVSSTDLVGGDVELSEEEKNRRERQRIYANGIISYDWDEQGKQILFPLGGEIYVYDLAAGAPRQLTRTESFETDAKFSPKGGFVSYVRDDELVVYDLAAGREKQVTSGAGGTIRNAVSEFVAQEELDRDTGYWWSPDDRRIAFTQIDEAPVKIAERVDINADKVVTISQRYPFAGTPNVTIKLGVVGAKGGKPVWVDLGADPDIYLARVYWSKDSSKLYVVRLSRDQKTLDFLEADPSTGKTKVLFSEESETWVNLSNDFEALDAGGFIWGSERSGFQQLYHYGADGALIGAVTSGPGQVNSLDCVDEEAGLVYYSGWRDSPLERHLFTAPLGKGETAQLTTKQGAHVAKYSKNCKTSIRYFYGDRQPSQAAVYGADGSFKFWLNENKVEGDHPYAPYLASHLDWTYGQLKAADGTPLDYKILKPSDIKRGEKRPAIVLVYGGPHAQSVKKGSLDTFAQMLADNGYVVFRLDNRGASNRGTVFENTLYRAMGTIEVEDQAVGARYLKSLPYVDGARIGVFGWSYGGYMTLRMLTATPDLYAAGVAGAPVTDWALYDTAYTERYMGKPQDEAEAYAKGSVFADMDDLKGRLLIIHGMADDNVVFLNSVKAMQALQKGGKSFELMTYPGEKHGFRATENKIHRDKLILNFFDRHLKDKRR
ncbi:MAG: S9 family peptidase [Pseudomonadota bacterium]|nr:S9 family peptidase [Pseudomonadota bacterium]